MVHPNRLMAIEVFHAPVVDVSNHHVIDSLEMKKVPFMAHVWEMAKGNKQMISRKLKEIQ